MLKDGFIRVSAATPKIRVADPAYNREEICRIIEAERKKDTDLLVFPELCLSGYTCGDLFLQDALLNRVREELKQLVDSTKGLFMLIFVGLPWMQEGKLYNVTAAICDGTLLGIIPKYNLPNYSEFYEARHFNKGFFEPTDTPWLDGKVPMGMNLLFACKEQKDLVVAAEICEDVWVPAPPSIAHATAGATVIVNSSASDETVGKDSYRHNLICGQSARLVAGYVYANAGDGESTQDLVFGGQNIIAEDGSCLAESKRFENGVITADMDLEKLISERRRMTTFSVNGMAQYRIIQFSLKDSKTELLRYIDPRPFVPGDASKRSRRCEEIFTIQALGLKKRLEHTGIRYAVLGISGGLDSALALLVTAKAFDLLGIDREQILAVTMPCFGTTDRTYQNACRMTEKLGATLKEVDIRKAVLQHFSDIGHDEKVHDVTYENGQARERTQVLMDIANQTGALVIGTGDMSELALGWATYNGDHMSMYSVNASVPKTLVRHLVRYYADSCSDEQLRSVLLDVLETPVSPELLPPKNGVISQKTEDLVGPYELHDFFMYYVLRFGFMPSKIYRLARIAFNGEYDGETILKWLKIYYKRFFSQQFKRSCLPDGPKVGSVAVSPRGDLRMPSDACARIWNENLEAISMKKKDENK